MRLLDADHESDRARRAYESRLVRARWMSREGYQHLFDAAGLAESRKKAYEN